MRRFIWDVYHIENYLLEPRYIAEAVNAIDPARRLDENMALEALRGSARTVVQRVLRHKMREYVNSQMVGCIDLGFDPAAEQVAQLAAEARLARSLRAVRECFERGTQREQAQRKARVMVG